MYRSQYTRAWEPVAEHEKIIEALKRRDPDEALYYLRSHIVRSADRLGIVDAREITLALLRASARTWRESINSTSAKIDFRAALWI